MNTKSVTQTPSTQTTLPWSSKRSTPPKTTEADTGATTEPKKSSIATAKASVNVAQGKIPQPDAGQQKQPQRIQTVKTVSATPLLQAQPPKQVVTPQKVTPEAKKAVTNVGQAGGKDTVPVPAVQKPVVQPYREPTKATPSSNTVAKVPTQSTGLQAPKHLPPKPVQPAVIQHAQKNLAAVDVVKSITTPAPQARPSTASTQISSGAKQPQANPPDSLDAYRLKPKVTKSEAGDTKPGHSESNTTKDTSSVRAVTSISQSKITQQVATRTIIPPQDKGGVVAKTTPAQPQAQQKLTAAKIQVESQKQHPSTEVRPPTKPAARPAPATTPTKPLQGKAPPAEVAKNVAPPQPAVVQHRTQSTTPKAVAPTQPQSKAPAAPAVSQSSQLGVKQRPEEKVKIDGMLPPKRVVTSADDPVHHVTKVDSLVKTSTASTKGEANPSQPSRLHGQNGKATARKTEGKTSMEDDGGKSSRAKRHHNEKVHIVNGELRAVSRGAVGVIDKRGGISLSDSDDGSSYYEDSCDEDSLSSSSFVTNDSEAEESVDTEGDYITDESEEELEDISSAEEGDVPFSVKDIEVQTNELAVMLDDGAMSEDTKPLLGRISFTSDFMPRVCVQDHREVHQEPKRKRGTKDATNNKAARAPATGQSKDRKPPLKLNATEQRDTVCKVLYTKCCIFSEFEKGGGVVEDPLDSAKTYEERFSIMKKVAEMVILFASDNAIKKRTTNPFKASPVKGPFSDPDGNDMIKLFYLYWANIIGYPSRQQDIASEIVSDL